MRCQALFQRSGEGPECLADEVSGAEADLAVIYLRGSLGGARGSFPVGVFF
jgi:hypothetical protein